MIALKKYATILYGNDIIGAQPKTQEILAENCPKILNEETIYKLIEFAFLKITPQKIVYQGMSMAFTN